MNSALDACVNPNIPKKKTIKLCKLGSFVVKQGNIDICERTFPLRGVML